VLSASDHVTAAAFLEKCTDSMGPKYLRFDAQVLPVVYDEATGQPDMELGFHVHRPGGKICLIATGYMLHTALKIADHLAAEGIEVGVVDLFNITDFSEERMRGLISSYPAIVTLEEGFRGRGGIDAMFFEFAARGGIDVKHLNIGVEGGYRFELGTRSELHEQVGIGEKVATNDVRNFLGRLN
jgi:transketolase